MTLEGKTAVITGASRGIGAALARLLHARGVTLGPASRSVLLPEIRNTARQRRAVERCRTPVGV